MRTTIFRSSWLTILLAGALVAPAQLLAQRADTLRTHVVRAGDTLWSLAAGLLPRGASSAQVARRVAELVSLNADRIDSPDLIRVGQQLRLR